MSPSLIALAPLLNLHKDCITWEIPKKDLNSPSIISSALFVFQTFRNCFMYKLTNNFISISLICTKFVAILEKKKIRQLERF